MITPKKGQKSAPRPPKIPQDYFLEAQGPLPRKKFIFDGFEGQMAWDISKKTFKKLIQFRKSILFFRNAPANLPVDLPRAWYLRGLPFANPVNFHVSLFIF